MKISGKYGTPGSDSYKRVKEALNKSVMLKTRTLGWISDSNDDAECFWTLVCLAKFAERAIKAAKKKTKGKIEDMPMEMIELYECLEKCRSVAIIDTAMSKRNNHPKTF